MAQVMKRLGYRTDKRGFIHYRERPLTWEQADKLAGQRLDRRRNYMVIDGQVCSSVDWTQDCSGCDGGGCRECGHTGLRRQGMWMPHDGSEPRADQET